MGSTCEGEDYVARVALVVDDTPGVARALRRCLEFSFEKVHVASGKAEAQAALASASPPVTHLICDYDLGEKEQTGPGLILALRAAYPTIQVAVLLTGLPITDEFPGVDRVFRKPCDMGELARFLLSGEADPG